MSTENKNRKGLISALKKPIQIYGLLLLIMESLFIILLERYSEHSFSAFFIFAIIIMPLFFGILFYLLFTKHPHVNFSPENFKNQRDFLELVRLSSERIKNWKENSGENIDKSFQFNKDAANKAPEEIKVLANRIEKLFNEFSSEDLLLLHNWYNLNNQHTLALICIDIAIAKNDNGDSIHFSYRAGSLRKLKRHVESLASAELAKKLDPTNIDSYYNIARNLLILGYKREAEEEIQHIYKSKNEKYIENISKYYKEEDN